MISYTSWLCIGTNVKTIGHGGTVNGWKSSVCSISGKKSDAANGGKTSATSRKCDAATLKARELGGIVNGWNGSSMNTNCAR